MLLRCLNSLSAELGLTFDGVCAFGNYKGFGVSVKAVEAKNCYIVNSWARKGALTSKTADEWFKEYMSKPENGHVKSYAAREYSVAAVLLADNDSQKNYTQLHGFIYDLISYFMMNYYANSCSACGSGIGLSIDKKADGSYAQMCRMCFEKENDAAQDAAFSQATAQNTNAQPAMQRVGAAPMGQPQAMQNVGTVPVGQPQATMQSVGVMGDTDTMSAIDPNTAPQSTGFSTAESLSHLPPPIQTGMMPDYSPQPIANDFRADPSYTEAPPIYSPVRPTNINDGKASNPLLGIVGSLLFTLAACVLWVLIGRLGYISYIGGLAMGFCCVMGYKLFGKKFDIFGLITGIIVILLAVLVCNIFIATWGIFDISEAALAVKYLGYDGFAGVFFNFFGFMNTIEDISGVSIMGEFIHDLLLGYLFAGIGFCVIGIPEFKNSR